MGPCTAPSPSSGPGILQDAAINGLLRELWAWVDGTSMDLDGPHEMHVARRSEA